MKIICKKKNTTFYKPETLACYLYQFIIFWGWLSANTQVCIVVIFALLHEIDFLGTATKVIGVASNLQNFRFF